MHSMSQGAMHYARGVMRSRARVRKYARKKDIHMSQFWLSHSRRTELMVVMYACELEFCMKHKITTLSDRFIKRALRREFEKQARRMMFPK